MKPFLKWVGSKYKIIEKIKSSLPSGTRLVEPFSGSGAVFLNTEYERHLIADANPDIINVFSILRDEGESFIDYVEGFFTENNNNSDSYYSFREEFNLTNDMRRKAAIFIYLNKHGFNGLCRYNSNGFFNVAFGKYTKPFFPKNEMLYFYKKISSSSVEIKVSDFRETMLDAKYGDVIYCDPPYVSSSDAAGYSGYTKGGFTIRDQENLAEMAISLQQKGIPVIISNHDTPYTRELYKSAIIESFDVQRSISGKIEHRNKARELIAIFS